MLGGETEWEKLVDEAMGVCISEFGENQAKNPVDVTFVATNQKQLAVPAIFELPSEEVDPQTQMRVITNAPQISFQTSALTQPIDQDDEVVIRGITYRVNEPWYDGQGTVTCKLARIS